MTAAGTFSARLQRAAETHGQSDALIFLGHGERETARWTADDLHRRIYGLSQSLCEEGLRGKTALIVHPSGPDFVVAMCACLVAGVIAVPAPDPLTRRHEARILGMTRVAQPAAVLGTKAQRTGRHDTPLAALRWIDTETVQYRDGSASPPPAPDDRSPAFLQFTSGSTRSPRGVIVTHGNLAANLAMIGPAFGVGSHGEECFVNWLPQYHDMGLIGGLLLPLVSGMPLVLMPPLAFMQKPERWLQAISRYRGTFSGAPDFAYALCAARMTPERMAGLDLSSWRLAYCGAERIRPSTMRRFADTLAPLGFRAESLLTCYGLAEATLFVTGEPADLTPTTTTNALSCGRSWGRQDLRIVDPATATPVPDGVAGEIWVAGPHISPGYWQDPDATAETFNARLANEPEGRFLRTGDIGVLNDGRLTVLGRLKHLIVIRGTKHHAEDIEATVASCHPILETGGSAAFAEDNGETEALVILHEVPRRGVEADAAAAAATAALRAVTDQHGVRASHVVLVPHWSLPRTSSGKVIRARSRDAWQAGTLDVIARAAPPARGTEAQADA
jgi:acyl-CoA synthetase (AMP-forming)/AMP-acid ligase II